MNKQGIVQNGKVVGGIEWTKTVRPDGTEYSGYTWNVFGGCHHGCAWEMPDGTIAECYAKSVAESLRTSAFFPEGFEHHYFHPDRLNEPIKLKKPAKIFIDSMSDMFGHWVPDHQRRQVLDVIRRCPQHTFQVLTKNAPALLEYEFPDNLWVGISVPPTFMFGQELTSHQQKSMLYKQMKVMEKVRAKVRFLSAEPLSFDLANLLGDPPPLEWIIIGAASRGRNYYQPRKEWVGELLFLAEANNIPVFFKGNLEWEFRKEEFPT